MMRLKLISLLFTVISATVFDSCKSKSPDFYETEVSLLKKTDYGSAYLKSVGYGNGRHSAIEDAQKKSFFVILFRGIPNTNYNYPLIENEVSFREKNANFNKDFFDNGLYKSFIISNSESSNLISTSRGFKIFMNIEINYEALRKYLEQNSIIRKFGY